ncbi:GNAT family N-acetyltransferase [Palleronia caenipelagi]|uniref:GNAT family N-acetyltransferase n=1 Tax=Palleronia caenipelagi TaxID=2489174 RepID=A0A547PRA2_9RHOB|nr:GNAT family N-acetyltransferase [Palleronia caenipelagi]TRD16621.1 GNAT family N-acetyltransferase [Palleronia caenipelagi]
MIKSFETRRLRVVDWSDDLSDPRRRATLLEGMEAVLQPSVLLHLPPHLQRPDGENAVARWVEMVRAESTSLTIRARGTEDLIGLLLLAEVPDQRSHRPIWHMGYLFAERFWGQGYCTELVRGLVAETRSLGSLTLIGGVPRDNPASAHVVQKAGFRVDPRLSSHDTEIWRLDF